MLEPCCWNADAVDHRHANRETWRCLKALFMVILPEANQYRLVPLLRPCHRHVRSLMILQARPHAWPR